MKWCFLINDVDLLAQFLGNIAATALREGDEVIVLIDSKLAEYKRIHHFPSGVKIYSKVDWCMRYYHKSSPIGSHFTWKEFFPDFDRHTSFTFSYQEVQRIVSPLYQWMDHILQKEKPDIVINQPPGNIFTEVAYVVCRERDIPYLGFIGSKFEGRVDVYNTPDTHTFYLKEFTRLIHHAFSTKEQTFVATFIENFISHKQLPPYQQYQVTPLSLIMRLRRYLRMQKKTIKPLWQYMRQRKAFRAFDKESEIILHRFFTYPFLAVTRRIRQSLAHNVFTAPDPSDQYYLFPLHVQPESSTSALATYFCDQINTITNAAFSLPFGAKLYVKEHPSALGHRSPDFYTRLQRIPNVVIINPEESAQQLIAHSQGVITLTSTMGMEAALAGKPVYILGNVFYAYHPMCYKVSGFEELRALLLQGRIPSLSSKELSGINTRFILSYFNTTVPGHVNDAAGAHDHNDYVVIRKHLITLAGL